jgi:hypothetical protein
MRVRERKREEGEGLAATEAASATDANPVVMLIVGLLTASPMTDDGIAHTNGTLPKDDLVAISGLVAFELVQGGGNWDKENRSS